MFGSNDDQNNQSSDQTNAGAPAGMSNDFGTMPPIESTPFGASVATSAPSDAPVTDAPADAPVTSAPEAPTASSSAPVTNGASDDLLTIKQDALQQLSPLVGHLEQTPEEKFRTTMMMIQAADDQSLVKTAYDAAKEITDDKARAQALLDVINEINYFTQHNQS